MIRGSGPTADLADQERVAGDGGACREHEQDQDDQRDQAVHHDEQHRADREQAGTAGDHARWAEPSGQRLDER